MVSSNNAVTAHGKLAATDLIARRRFPGGQSVGFTQFPLISVVNGARKLRAQLDVTLPSQVTLVSVGVECHLQRHQRVRCDFKDRRRALPRPWRSSCAPRSRAVSSALLKLPPANDSNPANDTREVSIEIAGATPAAVSESTAAGMAAAAHRVGCSVC